jgi:hypothetical protein
VPALDPPARCALEAVDGLPARQCFGSAERNLARRIVLERKLHGRLGDILDCDVCVRGLSLAEDLHTERSRNRGDCRDDGSHAFDGRTQRGSVLKVTPDDLGAPRAVSEETSRPGRTSAR